MSALIVLNKNRSPKPATRTRIPSVPFGKETIRFMLSCAASSNEAKIPHKTVYRTDHLFNLSNYPTFQVGVPASRFEEARMRFGKRSLWIRTNSDAAELLAPPSFLPDRKDRSANCRKSYLPKRISLAPNLQVILPIGFRKTTALVWSGDDAYIASAILGALNENDLHVRAKCKTA